MKIFFILLISASAYAADVQWSRLRGVVKALDYKAQRITIENHEGDLMAIPISPDVHITNKSGEEIALKDVRLDARVTLTLIPDADKPKVKEETFDEMNNHAK